MAQIRGPRPIRKAATIMVLCDFWSTYFGVAPHRRAPKDLEPQNNQNVGSLDWLIGPFDIPKLSFQKVQIEPPPLFKHLNQGRGQLFILGVCEAWEYI